MRLRALWRTTTFRLTALFGLVFALGAVALLSLVYLQSAVLLARRVDGILNTEAAALARLPPAAVKPRIEDVLALNGGQTNVFALFTPGGGWIAGNLQFLPPALAIDGGPLEIAPTRTFPAHARLIARRLSSGQILVVGRDVTLLRQMRTMITQALVGSGVVIILAGLACGVALSLPPLRRLQVLQTAGRAIAAGDLKRRMPISSRNDELDMFAATVNFMMDEVERLMSEVKDVSETIAHDLRTPLTRARAQLHRIHQAAVSEATVQQAEAIAGVTAEIDEVLERFRALMRISELEAGDRRSGFGKLDLADIAGRVVELYQPLAESEGVSLSLIPGRAAPVEADPKLLFEAVSNLVDNAIKFSRKNGVVRVGLGDNELRPRIIVQDDGPGIPEGERLAVLQRFYRSERSRLLPGSGLGLSIVAAIVHLHRFTLVFEDAEPGLRAIIDCRDNLPTS